VSKLRDYYLIVNGMDGIVNWLDSQIEMPSQDLDAVLFLAESLGHSHNVDLVEVWAISNHIHTAPTCIYRIEGGVHVHCEVPG